MTYDELNDVCKTLGGLFDTTITPGYIGNIWHAPYHDDRSWYVWFKDFPRGLCENYDNTPGVCLGSTEDVDKLRITAAFNRIAARYGVLRAHELAQAADAAPVAS